MSAALTQIHPTAIEEFKDTYSPEFLDLPPGHSEADLHGALLRNLSRTLSPALVAEYKTALPPRAVLRRKLHELYARLAPPAAHEATGRAASPAPTRRGTTRPSSRRRSR